MRLIPSQFVTAVLGPDSTASRTRLAVLEAGLRIITRSGIQALTLSELARESRLSKPRIAYHYSEMEEVVLDLFGILGRIGQEATRARVERARTDEERLFAIGEGACDWMQAHPEFARFFLIIYSYAPTSRRVLALHRQILEVGAARIESALEELGFKRRSARVALARAIQSTIIGLVFRRVSSSDDQPADEFASEMRSAIRRQLVTEPRSA